MRRLHSFEINTPVLGYGISVLGRRRKPRLVAVCGLVWKFERCFMWLEVTDRALAPANAIVRQGRRMLDVAQQLGETAVFCLRDEEPNSAKLLALVGFAREGDMTLTAPNGDQIVQELWVSWLS